MNPPEQGPPMPFYPPPQYLRPPSDPPLAMGFMKKGVIEIGGLLSCIGLVCGGISAEDVDGKIRSVMVSAGVAMIIATLVVLGIFTGGNLI